MTSDTLATYGDLPIEEIKRAVALKYDGDSVPLLIAKGEAEQANEIIDLANSHGIPLCDNAALVDLLSRVEIGDEVPEALYLSIAYILAFAYKISEEITSGVK